MEVPYTTFFFSSMLGLILAYLAIFLNIPIYQILQKFAGFICEIDRIIEFLDSLVYPKILLNLMVISLTSFQKML